MKRIHLLLCLIASMLVSTAIFAESADIEKLRKALGEKMPNLEITEISETQVPGLLELVSGVHIYYLTDDARYMMEGNLVDLDNEVNLTSQRKGRFHLSKINELGEENMLIFPSKDAEKKRWITVFTDTSCPYCSKLHTQVDELNEAGISVRYLLYPRAGLDSPAHKELLSVWCADDQQNAMTVVKAGGTIEQKTCDNPIAEHIKLAHEVGLRGTPLIYLDSGEIVPGYKPADQLVQMIDSSKPLAVTAN